MPLSPHRHPIATVTRARAAPPHESCPHLDPDRRRHARTHSLQCRSGQGLHALPGGVVHGDRASTHEIVSDRTGRTVSSTGPARAAIEAHSDPHRVLKRNLAHRLADARAEGVDNRAYDRLIMVAAPSALGALRPALCPDVRAKVTAESCQGPDQ